MAASKQPKAFNIERWGPCSPPFESGQAVTALTHQEAGDPRGWVRGGRAASTLLSAFQTLPVLTCFLGSPGLATATGRPWAPWPTVPAEASLRVTRAQVPDM